MVKDINFFSEYIDSQKSYSIKKVIIGTSTIVFIFISCTLGYSIFKIQDLSKNINVLSGKISATEEEENFIAANQVYKKRQLLGQYSDLVETSYDEILSKNVVTGDFLKRLTDTMPQELQLVDLVINEDSLEIKGIAKSEKEIADFKYNLDNFGEIEKSFIPSMSVISRESNEYQFSIIANFKGEVESGEGE